MDIGSQRKQEMIRDWWERNPMTYNRRGMSPYQEGTREWFEEIDRKLFSQARKFFAHGYGEKPFARLIPYANHNGKDVLEVGSGSGVHTRLLAEAGARLIAIDLTSKAVELTRRRLDLYGLQADVRRMDAEQMNFEPGQFDFIWSWGVIQHSSEPNRIVAELARVLRPGGEARVMVYHRHSINVLLSLFRGCLTGSLWKEGITRTLNQYSDGFIAHYFTIREAKLLFEQYFHKVETRVFGQKNELLPIPGSGALGKFKASVAQVIPDRVASTVLYRLGGFLFVIARKEDASPTRGSRLLRV